MKEKAKSMLQLEKMAFEEIQFKRDTSASARDMDYDMDFTRDVGTAEDGNHFIVRLTANLRSKIPDVIKVKITLTGYFTCFCDDERLKEKLINYNSVAILFPYIRSQISLITAQPDLTPVVLPPVNIVAMFEETEAKESDNEK
ncbi:MAG: protein-export chaperone SecB [Oscillospiraceae bacterium]|nr:protein-export chaperone SecB [Oscillospiraceae bacterium]